VPLDKHRLSSTAHKEGRVGHEVQRGNSVGMPVQGLNDQIGWIEIGDVKYFASLVTDCK